MAKNEIKIEDDGLVEVYIPRSGPNDEEQIVIGLNGVNTIIPKGLRVRVKPAVAEELNRSMAAKDLMYARKEAKIREAAEGKN